MSLSDEVVQMLESILDINENIFGLALLDASGKVLAQTPSWDIRRDGPGFVNSWDNNTGSVTIQGIRYITVENTPERLINTSPSGKGHVMGLAAGDAKLVAYINPAIGPTQVLNDAFLVAMQIGKAI
jgi:hypothetical protein